MPHWRVPPGDHGPALVHDGDRWLQVADIDDLARVDVDVSGAMDVRPLREGLSGCREDLNAVVFPVADVDDPLPVYPDAVGQVELARGALARRSPGGQQPAVAREPMDPAVAVSIRDVQVAGGGNHHLGGLVEGPGGSQDRPPIFAAPRVRRL